MSNFILYALDHLRCKNQKEKLDAQISGPYEHTEKGKPDCFCSDHQNSVDEAYEFVIGQEWKMWRGKAIEKKRKHSKIKELPYNLSKLSNTNKKSGQTINRWPA